MFYGHAVGNIFSLLIASVFLSSVLLYSGVGYQRILIWNSAVLMISLCLIAIEFVFKRIILDECNASFWLWLRMGFGGLATFLFGSVAFLLKSNTSIEYEMYILIMLITISTLTLSSYAVMLKYCFIVLATTLLPFTVYLFTKTGFLYSNLAYTVIIIQIVMLIKAIQMSKSAIAVLYLQEELMVEIEDHKSTKKHLDYLVNHDTLTGLPNRHFLIAKLHSLVAEAKSNHSYLSVLYIDLDGFKLVNDKFGHTAGDALLIEVAKRLRSQENSNQIVARVGGDEFIIIVYDKLPTESRANTVKQELMLLLCTEYQMRENSYKNIGASIGISNYENLSDTADSLLREADMAMYQTKRNKN